MAINRMLANNTLINNVGASCRLTRSPPPTIVEQGTAMGNVVVTL